MDGGWVSTKKPGRDDDLIARDRLRAIKAKKLKRKSVARARNPRKPPPRSLSSSSEDSLDGFIVEDDDKETLNNPREEESFDMSLGDADEIVSSSEDEKLPWTSFDPKRNVLDSLIDSPSPTKSSAVKRKSKLKKLGQKKKKRKKPRREDEDLALALAVEASQRETKIENVIIFEESDEEHPEEDEEYVDAAAIEANTVLATANSLRCKIVQALSQWTSKEIEGLSPEVGMIDNGALSLASLKDNVETDGNHSWISQAQMSTICPDVSLADYQLIGVNWMALLHGMKCAVEGSSTVTNVNGILADGKTVQTIAFLAWLKHTAAADGESRLPHCVVAPASVLSNWEREFKKCAPNLRVVKFHGSIASREATKEQLKPYLPVNTRDRTTLDDLDVVLVPMTYFQKESSMDRSFLRNFKYDYLVVDEAHQLKNARGMRYKYLDKFSTQHRLLLTGTPVQNSPKELLSLLCFLMPLFSRKSTDSFDDERHNDGGGSMLEHFVKIEGGVASNDAAAYEKLKQLFAPFVLRRRKKEVLSQVIPPKHFRVELVKMNKSGRQVYESVLSNHIKAKKFGTSQSREHLFTNLRKAAHHPLLLRTRYPSSEEKEHLASYFLQFGAFRGEGCTKAKILEELERYNDFQIHLTALQLIEENPLRKEQLNRYVLPEESLFSSAKFVALRRMLPGLIENGHRMLLFSVWTSCLDLISCLLEALNIKHMRMDGSSPVSERQSLIDEFNSDPSVHVFLLSTKACGLGINLTAADTCIFHDLDFNPTNDAQAEDRCHRIGQTKPVTVIRLVTEDSVDSDIYDLQQSKSRMSKMIMGTENEDWNTHASKHRGVVLKSALDRFLRSPNGKENSKNTIHCDEI